ncbi:hypothetical protein [Pseudomonas massiliensis]|uniref:hypothetical protein n=1 Tax=Pseudomonas massiliensis TaxID=522492 RepID=UPI00059152C3|nr:hypothetical protein [Pseudomonas massiliensis]
MTTAPYPTIIDEQLAQLERSMAMIGFALPVNEVLGLPREHRVADLKQRLSVTLKGKRVAVRARHE